MARGPQATHHQMLLNTIRHWDLTATDMLDPDYILPEGRNFGRITYEYYRNQSVAAALGFHFASEATSNMEFEAYLNGFAKFESAYKLRDRGDPALAFFVIHTEVEPAHRDMGYRMIQMYCDQNPDNGEAVIAGARAFMDAYGGRIGGGVQARFLRETRPTFIWDQSRVSVRAAAAPSDKDAHHQALSRLQALWRGGQRGVELVSTMVLR